MPEPLLMRYFDEIEVGDTQTTRGRTITETDVVNWCTGDVLAHQIHRRVRDFGAWLEQSADSLLQTTGESVLAQLSTVPYSELLSWTFDKTIIHTKRYVTVAYRSLTSSL